VADLASGGLLVATASRGERRRCRTVQTDTVQTDAVQVDAVQVGSAGHGS